MVAIISFAMSVMTFLFGGGVIVSFYKSLKSIKLGVQAMLRDRLLEGHRFYIKQGYISYIEMDTMVHLYDMYHSLGANGVMDEIINDIKELPIK